MRDYFETERQLTGWLSWLADDDSDIRQFAARMATSALEDYGLTWADVARHLARLVAEREASSRRAAR